MPKRENLTRCTIEFLIKFCTKKTILWISLNFFEVSQNFSQFLQDCNCLRFNCPHWTSMQWLFALDSYHWAKDNVKYFFSAWFSDHGIFVKNDEMFGIFFFPTNQLWRHNILYMTRSRVPCILKIDQYTKSNLKIYNLSMSGEIIFVVRVNYDVISI